MLVGGFASTVMGASPQLYTLASFGGRVGSDPNAGVQFGPDGALYATAASGGNINGEGAIAKLLPGTSTLQSVAVFPGALGGEFPMGGVNFALNGNLYTLAESTGYSLNYPQGGAIERLPAGSNTLQVAHLFPFASSDGIAPITTMTMDGNGNLYGTTSNGGTVIGAGTFFKYSTTTGSYSYIPLDANCNGAASQIQFDLAGNAYFTTYSGENTEVLAISPSNKYSVVATASYGLNYLIGDLMRGSLALDPNTGYLYGTTAPQDPYDDPSSVFQVQGNVMTVYANLPSGGSLSGVIIDAAGNLFGTTVNGGTNGTGSVFEIPAGTQNLVTLASFGAHDGVAPDAPLTVDSEGNLYSTTSAGGTSDSGTIFELANSGFVTNGVTVNPGTCFYFPVNSNFSSPASGGISTHYVAGINIQAQGLAVLPAVGNIANRQLLVVSGNGLSLSGSRGAWVSTLDLNNNDIDLTTGDLGTVTSQLAQGYNGGSWNGVGGIISLTAAADTTHLHALGVIQNNQDAAGTPIYSASHLFDGTAPGAADILIKYTYYGDANLDGKVDGSDYSLIDGAYLNNQNTENSPLTGWFNGDFNYDGVIDGSDYTLMDNAFNRQGAQLSAEVATVTAQIAVAGPSTAVPEPTSLAFVLIAAGALGRRRRVRSDAQGI
jgi:uncharacterized repeat protein (TIGR03803 family)